MRYLVGLIILFFSYSVEAQDTAAIWHKPRGALRFSPLQLLGNYPTLLLGYETSLNRSYGLLIDAGPVLNPSDLNEDYQNERGLKTRLELRYYFKSKGDAFDGYYGAMDLYGNAVNFARTTLEEECFDPLCQSTFMRYYSYGVRYREAGFTIKGGYMEYLGPVFLDMSIGWALRAIRYDHDKVSDNVIWDETWNLFERNEEDRIQPWPSINLRIGVRIR